MDKRHSILSAVFFAGALVWTGCSSGSDDDSAGPIPHNDASTDAPPAEVTGCKQSTCAGLGAECGAAVDGCGGELQCGFCSGAESCGGAGPNKCGNQVCTAKTCAQLGATCGQVSDSCSAVLSCGSCVAGETCSNNRCVSSDAGADSGGDGAIVPLVSILINNAQGTSTTIPNPVANTVVYTPSDATDKSLSWVVCDAQPTDCKPDPNGHCRTCTPTTGLGSVTSGAPGGVYTPPANIVSSPQDIFLLACQGSPPTAICDYTFVTVSSPGQLPTCGNGPVTPSGCLCGGTAKTTGYCCSGTWQDSACSTVTGNLYGTGTSSAPQHISASGGGAKPSCPNASACVSVVEQGADPNGSSDSTSAFQAAFTAAGTTKPVLVPPGKYLVAGDFVVSTSIVGQGYPLISVAGADGAGDHRLFKVRGAKGIWITGLQMDGGFDPTGQAVLGPNCANQYDHGIDVQGTENDGITIEDNLIQNMAGDSIYLNQSVNVVINSNTLINAFRNIVTFITSDTTTLTNNITLKLNTYVITFDIEANSSSDTNYRIEIAYNQSAVPTSVSTACDNQYRDITDINCKALGGSVWWHDNSAYPGGTPAGQSQSFPYTGFNSFYHGTHCSDWTDMHCTDNPPGSGSCY